MTHRCEPALPVPGSSGAVQTCPGLEDRPHLGGSWLAHPILQIAVIGQCVRGEPPTQAVQGPRTAGDAHQGRKCRGASRGTLAQTRLCSLVELAFGRSLLVLRQLECAAVRAGRQHTGPLPPFPEKRADGVSDDTRHSPRAARAVPAIGTTTAPENFPMRIQRDLMNGVFPAVKIAK